MITLILTSYIALAASMDPPASSSQSSEKLEIPSSSTVMDCGKPDPRETKQDGTYTCTNHYKKEIPNAKFTIRKGKLDGQAFGYREDGTPEFEGNFKKGFRDGKIKTLWSEKKKRFNQTTQYVAGKRNGPEMIITDDDNDNRQVKLFKNDEKHGFTYYFRQGKMFDASDCEIDGQRAGPEKCQSIVIPGYESDWAEYQNAQKAKADQEKADANREVIRKNRAGQVIERYKLKDNQVWGKYERFYANGKLALESEQEASRKKSETEYFEEGQKKRTSLYDGRAEVKHDEWYQNGKPKLSWTRTFGPDRTTISKFREYYDNGQVREEGTRVGTVFYNGLGDYDGELKTYLETGALYSVENYRNKRKDGLQKIFTEDDTHQPIQIEEVYASGILQKVTTVDAKTKKTRRIQEFMPDGSTKSDKKF